MSQGKLRARQQALELLRSYGTMIPVDIEKIVAERGISISYDDLEDDISGMLVISEQDSARIGINKKHSKNRRRFSLAHELGHYVLHKEEQSLFVDASSTYYRDELSATGTDLQEIEANTFAAELLMPEEAVSRLIRQHKVDLYDESSLETIAKKFQVSPQALAFRLINLGILSP